jgi:hypothetical protein
MLKTIWNHQRWNSKMGQSSFWGTRADEEGVSQEYDEYADSVDEDEDEADEEDNGIDGEVEEVDKGGDEDEESDEEGDDETFNSEEIELAELMFELSIAFASEEFEDGQPRSSLLVYFSGVLGLSDDGLTYRRAKHFTTRLSGLIYVLRLLFLEHALPYRKYTHLGIDRRPRHKHLERLNAIRHRFMLYGCLTPLGEFQSLRDFGRIMARTDPPSFLLRWSDDGNTLYYDDTSITMDKFRTFSEHLVQLGERQCSGMMYDWLPKVDFGQVKDEWGNTRKGFSFIHHAGNKLADAYLQLSARACTTEDGGLIRNGEWNHAAISQYLRRKEAFLETLMAILHTTGGQAPRSTELFSLEYQNGSSTERGVYVYNGRMAYVTRYHKARRSTNKEFNVVRFLPPQPGLLLFYYLVYIFPFTKMLLRESGGANRPEPRSSLLFHSDQAPDKPWLASRLTAVLRKASAEVLDKPVGVRLYRQLSIGITEKHVKEVFRPFNRHDDTGLGADRNAALAWQSGHRPLLRADNYGLDGAFPTKLQPSLLSVYEWASTRWHEFLYQPSKAILPTDEAKYAAGMRARRIIEQNGQRRAQPGGTPWKEVSNAKLEKIAITPKEKDGRRRPSADIPPPWNQSQSTSKSHSDRKNALSSAFGDYAQSLVSSPYPCSDRNQAAEPWNKGRCGMSLSKPSDPDRTVERKRLLHVDEGSSDVEDVRPVKRRLLSREWKQSESTGARPKHQRHNSISSDSAGDSCMESDQTDFDWGREESDDSQLCQEEHCSEPLDQAQVAKQRHTTQLHLEPMDAPITSVASSDLWPRAKPIMEATLEKARFKEQRDTDQPNPYVKPKCGSDVWNTFGRSGPFLTKKVMS